MRRLALAGGILLVLPLAGCGLLQSTPTGFHDIEALQNSVLGKMLDNENKMLADPQGNEQALIELGIPKTVTCVHENGNDYSCLVEYDKGSKDTLTVTVADDGQSWVSR